MAVSKPPRVAIDGQGRLCAVEVFPWREQIKDLPGSYWTGKVTKAWAMPCSASNAAALLTILGPDSGAVVSAKVAALVTEYYSREDRRSAAADQLAPLPELPWRDWVKTDPIWHHQKRGMIYLPECTGAAIGAGMGTGKSLMAVGALNRVGARRVLIVGPSATLGVFPREFRQHSAVEWHVENGTRKTRRGTIKKLLLTERWELAKELFKCGCGKPHAMVIGYEALTRDPVMTADLGALGVDVIVYDEVHRLKAAGGTMSWTARQWVNQVKRRWGMSGTLMPQGPWDIFGTYRALDPGIFGISVTSFRSKYIEMVSGGEEGAQEFPVDVKKDMKLEFSKLFHSIAYVPVVDLKLPPVTHTIRSFHLEPKARLVYDSIRDRGIAEISEAVKALGGAATVPGDVRTVTPANAGVELLRFAQITGGSVTDDEGFSSVVSTAKVDALREVLDEVGCRKGGRDGKHRPEPVVVFARFRPDLDAIRALAEKLGLRYREVSGSRKDGLDEESKMHPDADVLGAQIASGGVGVDYTRSRVAVWYSIGFELWLFQQAQKRVYRPGQTRPTANYYLIAENTIDSSIYAALARRESVVESCLHAYLNHLAEQDSEDLPQMPVPEGEATTEPPNLPGWLLGDDDDDGPRGTPDKAREEENRQLALFGMAEMS